MKTWQDFGFEIEITGDQSPSLHLLQSSDPTKNYGESMHHSGGAASETLLIYGEPIKNSLKRDSSGDFLVVGLGLGYIEMTVAREALLAKILPQNISILSFESVPELREAFEFWLAGSHEVYDVAVFEVYDQVARSILKGTDLEVEQVKMFLRSLKSFEVQGALETQAQVRARYDGILYDAFSSKTTPHLWDEAFLKDLIFKSTKPGSFVSTYACKGSLKRALRENGFEVIVREGFMGKRNSTLGLRSA